MRKQFVELDQIQIVVDGFNKLYKRMIDSGKIEAADMKNFMESYFEKAGYREKIKSTKNILIIHDSGVGDFIVMSAVIREIRRIYSRSHITLLVDDTVLSMAENCPYIDKLIDYPLYFNDIKKFSEFYQNIIKIAVNLLGRRLDIVFNFGHYPGSQLLSYMCGAKERIFPYTFTNFNAGLSMNLFSSFATFISQADQNKIHDNEMMLEVLSNYSNKKIHNKNLEIWLSPSDHFKAELHLQRVSNKKLYAIIMSGNVNLKRKRWSPKNYAALCNMILNDESDSIFVILGGAEDIKNADEFQSLVDNSHLINLTGKLNYRQSAAVLSYCDCYIGNDTGLMHAAAALNIPILTPNCFAADLNLTNDSFLTRFYPYNVPSVIVRPEKSLDDCAENPRSDTGCNADHSHCIDQISPEKMFEGLKLLNEQIKKSAKEPIFLV